MTSCVVVLLKLLLATVTSPGANGLNAGLPGAGLTSPTQEMPRKLPTTIHLERANMRKHRRMSRPRPGRRLTLLDIARSPPRPSRRLLFS
jgi:hypothetical protein